MDELSLARVILRQHPGRRAMKALLAMALLAATLATPALAQTPVPTWNQDVGPLLAKHCMNCHRPGEIAPMSLLTYETARPWARSIRNEVLARVMPPWPADPAFGRFSNDRRLSDADVNTIVAWVNAGAPKGEGTFTPPTFADGWLLGEPDLIVEMEQDYVVPAGGPDINIEIPVPIRNLPHDVWVRAVEVRGNPSVVHHNVVYSVDAQGTRDATGRLASFTPGKQYDLFNEPAGKLVKKGSTLVFSMHYHPNGAETRDRSKVGLFLATKPISYQIHSRVVADPRLEIPPREPNYLSAGEFTFAVDAEITLFKPHMHWRGKDMKYVLRYPDGREETLLSVPRYDMNWQVSYELAEPKPVPKGSVLKVIAHFDNSPDNPRNPDPNVKVLWGSDSRDEMMEGWFDYRVKMSEVVIPPTLTKTSSQQR
jgi:mono/diheme cytochrome c family protein